MPKSYVDYSNLNNILQCSGESTVIKYINKYIVTPKISYFNVYGTVCQILTINDLLVPGEYMLISIDNNIGTYYRTVHILHKKCSVRQNFC